MWPSLRAALEAQLQLPRGAETGYCYLFSLCENLQLFHAQADIRKLLQFILFNPCKCIFITTYKSALLFHVGIHQGQIMEMNV